MKSKLSGVDLLAAYDREQEKIRLIYARKIKRERSKKIIESPDEKRKRLNRESKYKRVYGITIEEYQYLFDRQYGRCAICQKTNKVLCVDHDHNTGKIRGLLCRKCNAAIGMLGDTSESVLCALEYLIGSKLSIIVD